MKFDENLLKLCALKVNFIYFEEKTAVIGIINDYTSCCFNLIQVVYSSDLFQSM